MGWEGSRGRILWVAALQDEEEGSIVICDHSPVFAGVPWESGDRRGLADVLCGGNTRRNMRVKRRPAMSSPLLFLRLFLFLFLSLSLFPAPSTALQPSLLQARRSTAENRSISNSSFILAAERTRRKDPLDGYNYYTGGWNISNNHYWASVGFTAAPLFLIAAIWFIGFALTLLLICCCFCCCPGRRYTYSKIAYSLALFLLIVFTCAAIVGCIFLYTGQEKLHISTSNTLDYVVGQAELTVENLQNFSDKLTDAKKVSVDRTFLPGDLQKKIDDIEKKLNSSANQLATRTRQNSKDIKDVLDNVRLYLIIIAAVMLGLTFLGFVLSLLGLPCPVYTLLIVGWVLVAGTFVLAGIFLLLHIVIADACVAMGDWVQHPQEYTALDDILPCVDFATANESLYRSKEVTFQLTNVVNQYIANVSNKDFLSGLGPFSFNQSGPLVPLLCNPFHADLTDRRCLAGEVDFDNATQVWQGYICKVSSTQICMTTGRITPRVYDQFVATTSVGSGCYKYGPFLANLQDCTFVRDTFSLINSDECPDLRKHSKWVYVGLAVVSGAVMFSLIFWVVYSKERRHRKKYTQFAGS